MIKYIFLLFISTSLFAQEVSQDTTVYSDLAVDRLAAFQGGKDKLARFLSRNFRYPPDARKNGTQGKVVVQFIVEKDGGLSFISIKEGLAQDCDKEAMRVVGAMPKWTPAELQGKKVRSLNTLPMTFKLAGR